MAKEIVENLAKLDTSSLSTLGYVYDNIDEVFDLVHSNFWKELREKLEKTYTCRYIVKDGNKSFYVHLGEHTESNELFYLWFNLNDREFGESFQLGIAQDHNYTPVSDERFEEVCRIFEHEWKEGEEDNNNDWCVFWDYTHHQLENNLGKLRGKKSDVFQIAHEPYRKAILDNIEKKIHNYITNVHQVLKKL